MDEQTLAKLIRETVSQEINSLRQEMKAELDKIRSEMVTKEDLKAFVTKEDLKQFATKEDLKAFATKEDLKPFATKEDLKQFATKEDFLEFERRLNSAIEKIREGVRLYILDLEREIVEIKSKLRFYDFDYIARQNDAMIKILKDLYEEKTIISEKLKEHEKRITDIETIAKIV